MKRYLKVGLAALFILLLLLGGVTVHTIVKAQSYGKLINYVGIVRGATQRLVKLELADRPSDEIVAYLDGILQELGGGEGRYGLPAPDDAAYRQKLNDLQSMWTDLKEKIRVFRENGDGREALLDGSEAYFDQANDTVFAADEYAARQIKTLLIVCIVMLCIMMLTWFFIFWAISKKMLRLEQTNQILSDIVRRDPVTGAYQIEDFKKEAQRLLDTEPGEKFAVVYTDFADFKYINDVFGYAYGDGLLAEYAKILQEGLREKELLGRVSADNFVLLLRYGEKGEIAVRQRAADRQIGDFMYKSRKGQSLSTYCGICCLEDVVEQLKIDALLDRANFARKTVRMGTNHNYVYYDEGIRKRLFEEKKLENRMLGALERHEFQVYYQPKVELKTGKIACSEALVRWRLADGDIVAPDRFIPVFEQKMMIDRLDRYVLEEVCKWLRSLLDADGKALPVSVNVSRLQFYDPDFINQYTAIKERYRIPSGLLEIEFTESIVFDNTRLLVQIVDRLKQAGFSCAIDDFGKGYSSLSLLKSLPVDVVKIDRFFFEKGTDEERDLAVVQGVVEILGKLRIKTVAEGVESPRQVEFLKRIGCDYVQGYIFFRPMPQAAFEELLAKTP